MPFEIGKPRAPKAGRKAGTPNATTQELIDILCARGYDPLAELIYVATEAKKNYERNDEKLDKIFQYAADKGITHLELDDKGPEYLDKIESCATTIMKYYYPQRKALDLTSKGNEIFQSFSDLVKAANEQNGREESTNEMPK